MKKQTQNLIKALMSQNKYSSIISLLATELAQSITEQDIRTEKHKILKALSDATSIPEKTIFHIVYHRRIDGVGEGIKQQNDKVKKALKGLFESIAKSTAQSPITDHANCRFSVKQVLNWMWLTDSETLTAAFRDVAELAGIQIRDLEILALSNERNTKELDDQVAQVIEEVIDNHGFTIPKDCLYS